MDTELQKIANLHKPQRHNVLTRDPNGDEPKYTSLRDILPHLPTTKGATSRDHGFDSANISIRNQLVKHAASAYLQSAAILASRNSSLGSLWEDAPRSATSHSIWCKYVVNPLKACIKFIIRPICWIAKHMANRICL